MTLYGKIISIIAACVAPMFFAAPYAPKNVVRQTTDRAVCAAADPTLTDDETAVVKVRVLGDTIAYIDKPIVPSDFTVAEEINARRINAPLAEKMQLVDEYMQKGADYKTALNVCFPLLDGFVADIAKKVYVAPVDADVVYSGGRFNVTKERTGERLDEDRLYGGIYYALRFGSDYNVKATTLPIMPTVTRSELKDRLILRGEYTTDYSTSSVSRAHNVTLAVKKFDGVKIPRGGTLSFNDTVGARTEENGFESAKVIINGEYVDGVGGGVCQASTAIYNAALTAGLDCAANAHSICPSYVKPGLDAMISSMSDLTITNNTGSDVYMSVSASNGYATVRVFGEKNPFTCVPESEVVKTVEYEYKEVVDTEHRYFGVNAASGERIVASSGKDGYESVTYMRYYKDGKFVKRVKLRTNVYKSVPQITVIAP